MIVFKDGIKGGYLAMPEYDISVECKNGAAFFFDGQKILHGVTPIEKTKLAATRYSVVYYSLQQMWSCLPLGMEIERIKKLRSDREMKRFNGVHK